MPKSKIAVFSSSDAPLVLKEVEIPELRPGEVLVKNEYATLCRSDLYTFSGRRQEKTPTILGHEIVGRIAAFGPDSPTIDERGANLSVGDRISWAIYASDPDGELAQKGIPQKAPDLFKYGHERITSGSNLHGGLSQYAILRAHTPIVKIDEALPLPAAAIINCAVATVAGALRLAGDLVGKNVLISGAGMLGMIACAMSKTRGAAKVIALDINEERLDQAAKFGADMGLIAREDIRQELAEVLGESQPFHTIIELSGAASAMEQTLGMLSVGGAAVWVGATFPQRDLQVNAEKIVRGLWTIKGLHNYNREDFVAAVQFMEQNHRNFPFASMVYDRFVLDEVNEAFACGLEQNPFRVGLRID